MIRKRSLYGQGGGIVGRFTIEATTVAGALLIRNASAATAGEVEDPTTTAAAHTMGIAMEAVTYSTNQALYDGFPGYRQSGEEGTVGILCDPYQVIQARVSGGATVGTALGATSPANILTNTVASTSGLVITAAEVGTIDMSGGLIIGRTGNNAGVVRRMTTHNNNTDCNVIVPFPRTIEAGATFLRSPFSKSTLAAQLTATVFTEVNGIIAFGTGCNLRCLDVAMDIIDDEILVDLVCGDHFYSPIA